jgi:hypothetical protein
METYNAVKGLDWSIVSQSGNVSNWLNRLWPIEQHHHWLGRSGGYGVGYGAPASVGAALANRDLGRFSVNIQADGDLMYAPGVLWTAAKHKIPQLAVMHNNRGYHQEVMHVQRLANFRSRASNYGGDLGPVGTRIENPDIEYHKLAESMGWWARGPIKEASQLASALREAVKVVQSGTPALVNVWTPTALRTKAMRLRLIAFTLIGLVATPALAADAAKGKSAFMKNGCWQCHGEIGQGGCRGKDARAKADALRGVQRLRAQLQRSDAAVSEGNSLGRGSRRHPRLSAVDSGREGLQEHSAAQPVDLDFKDIRPATKRNAPVARKTGTEPSAAPRPPKASGTAICVTLFAMMRIPSASPERPFGAWL